MRENLNDLHTFLIVAREGSFTRAAALLGVSQSALSHTIRNLETRLGLRLLTRTTRSVSPTVAGERLIQTLAPRFEEIEAELAALTELRDKPAGSLRITAAEHAASYVLWPRLMPFLTQYPDINIEINTDYRFTDIVAQRFDAGVRLGDQVEKDMIAVRISSDLVMATVASPGYFETRRRPETPHELSAHRCINLRLATHGGLNVWEFEKDGHAVKARVDGQLTFNTSPHILRAALAGFGIAHTPADMAAPYIANGQLIEVLMDWRPSYPGYHLYYPSRRQTSPAFALLVKALRIPG